MFNEQVATDWLCELTALPTAAGREHHVAGWVRRWVAERSELSISADRYGNLLIGPSGGPADGERPIAIVAHMDHPAFVVESVGADGILRASFRGGVHEAYFKDAPVTIEPEDGQRCRGIVRSYTKDMPWGSAEIEVQGDVMSLGIAPGDIARWEMPGTEIESIGSGRGVLRTAGCDNVASVAASLAFLERLREEDPESLRRVLVLLTRAEEVGFLGAICAARSGLLPENARVIVLENSRSFVESPIGGGVILRVGDRVSVFAPALTGAVGKVAVWLREESKQAESAGEREHPFLWQRKLMPGGACEATVFQTYGYEATCVCLPLGNYHNMAALDEFDAGDERAIANARCAREYISVDDFFCMVELLVGVVQRLGTVPSLKDRLEGYYEQRTSILFEPSPSVERTEDIAPMS